MIRIIYICFLMFLVSCAKVPVESLKLMDALQLEGKRMHELNVKLVNRMFSDKKANVDRIINEVYIPAYLKNFKDQVPDGTDYEMEFEDMLASIVPVIAERRNQALTTLEEQRVKIITQLETDYLVYSSAMAELQAMVRSAVEVNEARTTTYEQLKSLTNNGIDLNQLGKKLDAYIHKAGDIGEKIGENNEAINNAINKIINK